MDSPSEPPEVADVTDKPSFQTSGLQTSAAAAAAAKSLQSCPTLCDPIDGSPPGSPVPEILQARTLEWVAIDFSVQTSKRRHLCCLSHQVCSNLFQQGQETDTPDSGVSLSPKPPT